MSRDVGTLTVICGSMFSGKSEEVIRRVKWARIADKKVQVFKPKVDNRYSETQVVTHYGSSVDCEIVENGLDIYTLVDMDTELIVIDEVQFFSDELISSIRSIKRFMGIDIVVSGLDMWADGNPIPLVGQLLCIADEIHKLKAVCVETGEDAYISHRTVEAVGNVVVGGAESYVALSEKSFLKATGIFKD